MASNNNNNNQPPTAIDLEEKNKTPFTVEEFLKNAAIKEKDIPRYVAFLTDWGLTEPDDLLELTVEALRRHEVTYKSQPGSENFVLVGRDAEKIANTAAKWGTKEGGSEDLFPISRFPKSNPVPRETTFFDRDEEVKELFSICVDNIVNLEKKRSEFPPILVTLAQMFGSGKTTLGIEFLYDIKKAKYNDFITEKRNKHGKIVDEFLNQAQLLYVDLRKLRDLLPAVKTLNNYICCSVLHALISEFPNNHNIDWNKESLSKWTLSTIIDHYQDSENKRLFIVLDEIDVVCTVPTNIGFGFTLDHVKQYYELWTILDVPTRNIGATFCCCGKSSILFSIGRGWYHKWNIASPGIAHLFVLNPFNLSDILGYLRAHLGSLPGDNSDEFNGYSKGEVTLARLLKLKTAGVPRLLHNSIEYLKTNLANSISPALFGSAYREYMIKYVGGSDALGLYHQLNDASAEFYIECVRMAALKIPLELSLPITPSKLGLTDDSATENLPSVMEVCALFSLYAEKVGHNSIRFLFPELVLDNLARLVNHPRLAFWSQLLTAFSALDSESGHILEAMVKSSIGLRMCETLRIDTSQTISDLFSFIPKDSFIGSEPVPHKQFDFGTLPKFVTTGVASIGAAQNKDEKVKKIEDCMKSKGSSGVPNVLALDWKYVHPFLQPYVLYAPGGSNGKSFSADAILEFTNSTWALQMKATVEEIGPKEIADEMFKAYCGKQANKNMTFLVAATHIGDLSSIKPKPEEICDSNKKILAYRLRTGTTLAFTPEFFNNQRNNFIKSGMVEKNQTDFTIPNGMEAIILTREGMIHFITSQNLELLEEPTAREAEVVKAAHKVMTRQRSFGIQQSDSKKPKIV